MTHLLETKYKFAELTEKDYIELLEITNAQVNLRAEQNPNASRLSATYAGVILQGDHLMWSNLGDSRIDRFRKSQVEQLSLDHNFAFRQFKRGEISEMQYRFHPRKNQLFDCMGGGHTSIHPEIGTEKWETGDIYLICSDGIMDGLTDRKIESIIDMINSDLDQTRSQKICAELLKQAVSNDGSDDTTLVIFQIL